MNSSIYQNDLRRQIVEKADIVSIISEYVKLEKKGANYIGLCPFHNDTNPSMSVSPSKKVFKCFSCNTGGDVITFVSKIKNISIRDAMRIVGDSCGIKVEVTKKEIEHQKNAKYYEIMMEASKFYHFYLLNSLDAKDANAYLFDRGLEKDIINTFNIGVSASDNDLFKILTNKKYIPLDLIEVGLIRSNKDSYVDVFKNRIMFPLEDLDGNVVGFSGRRYKKDDNDSKYLNTFDTVIFKKGQILYNYHRAFNDIKANNCVYLFEGFMDVIAAYRADVKNSVASMGTALTFDQIKALKRITNNVIVCYDSDEPGTNATLKAIKELNSMDVNVSVVRIPSGKDPDEYIKANGKDALKNILLNKKVNAIDFVYFYYANKCNFNDLSSKELLKNNIFEIK